MKLAFVSALAWLLVLLACGTSRADRPTIFAAASLREAVEELCELYEREGNPRPRLNIAASNLLARQVLAGARADLLFSADELQVDLLEQAGHVEERRSLLSNRLAVIYPRGVPKPVMIDGSPPWVATLCIANDAVPLGRYTDAWFRGWGFNNYVYQRVVPAISARGVLAAVESGAVDAGVVYATDAAISDKVRVAFVLGGDAAADISYSLARLTGANASGASLFEFLSGPRAAEVFGRHGFLWRGEQ